MIDEVLINAGTRETRVALLGDGQVQEIRIERHDSRGVVGNIYLGTVMRVLPGMQAAFIDIGLERTAFLHARDLVAEHAHGGRPVGVIDVLHEGQKITVQALKNPIGDKGARLSTRLSIAARTLVYLPNSDYFGISRRVEQTELRQQLWYAVDAMRANAGEGGGVIVRTSAAETDIETVRADFEMAVGTWREVRTRRDQSTAPALLHRDLPLALRALRDLPWRRIEKVRIDCKNTWLEAKDYFSRALPDAVGRIEHYGAEQPIFDLHGVENAVNEALQRRVVLESGGHMTFDRTEAMTTVDINTGSFVGKHNFEETILQTNLEAVEALARQLRVRNIGGIVIVDFIDMGIPAHRDQVMRALGRALSRDPVKTGMSRMSALGLVEISRKRTGESLEALLTEPCPTCGGSGMRNSAQTICYEILRELRRGRPDNYRVVASSAVIDVLRNGGADDIAGLASNGKKVELHAEPSYRQEQFDVVAG